MNNTEEQVLLLVTQFVSDLGNQRALNAISLDARLDKDLGLGSLERVELSFRLNQSFDVQLPDHAIFEVDTLRDLAKALQQATPAKAIKPHDELRPLTMSHAAATPVDAATLNDVLQHYGLSDPNRPHIYLQTDSGEEQTISYGKLLEAATTTAAGILNYGISPGSTVALMLPTSKDFFYAFWGILLAGCVPVPIYPPARLDRIEEYALRAAAILHNARACLLITVHAMENLARLLKPLAPTLVDVVSVADMMLRAGKPAKISVQAEDTALIQYTSGSTGHPKGVELTHANLLANIRAIEQALNIRPTDVIISWLPLYHDMGLIGAWLGSLYFGIPINILSPLAFLGQPERWLWAIHAHRGTLSAAPNFAYELCVNKIQDKDIHGLDLSSWRATLNGAEAVNPETIARFSQRFAAYGFRPEAMLPVYGLAESSVGLAIPPLGRLPRIDKIVRDTFNSQHLAVPAPPNDASALQFVSCGMVLPGHEIRITDEQNQVMPERTEGLLQFRGPSSMKGYFHAPEKTAAIYHDGWWNSGDLAYLSDQEIFITGRRKDVIIKGGRNYYPQEFEEITMQVPGIRKGCVVAFGITESHLATEKIIIVAETRERSTAAKAKMTEQIIEKIVALVGIPPDQVHLVTPGTILKTSSGKLRRAACREAYLNHKLVRRYRPAAWLQIVKLWLKGAKSRIKHGVRQVSRGLYVAYFYTALFTTLFLTWIMVLPLPTRHRAIARLTHYWARSFLWLVRCKPSTTGLEHLAKNTPMILIANHVSYLDASILLAALPYEFIFVAKQEVLKMPFICTFIKKQQHITVDRKEGAQGALDTQLIEKKLRQGQSVIIFPEGTIARVRGIRPFKLGAFKAAAETAAPICPIAITGTRHILPDGSWLPQPAPTHVAVLPPLQAVSTEWDEIIRLRNEARAVIARCCEEGLLDL